MKEAEFAKFSFSILLLKALSYCSTRCSKVVFKLTYPSKNELKNEMKGRGGGIGVRTLTIIVVWLGRREEGND